MATTTRKKVAPKIEVVEEPKEVTYPETLHPDHLRQLEVISRDVENARLTMAIEEQALKNMTLELQLLQQKIDRQKQNLQQKAVFYDNSTKQFKKLKSELWPQYGFSQDEGLGYDPNTGAIHK